MTDRSHLDELVAETVSVLGLELVEAFRAMIRDPAINPTDYATLMKSLLEDSLSDEADDAPR
jgi:hypothetical protein